MTDDKKPSKLEDFVTSMDVARKIEEALKTSEEDTREEMTEEARAKLKKEYEAVANRYGLKGEGREKFLDGKDRDSEQLRRAGLNDRVQTSYELAAQALNEGTIEGIVNDLKEEKLEGLVLGRYGEEVTQLVQSKAGKEYGEWIKLYANSVNAKMIAKDGIKKAVENRQISKEQAMGMRQPYAERLGNEAAEKTKAEGLGKGAQERAKELTEALILGGYIGGNEEEALKEFAADAEKKLKEYEAEKGVSLRGYVTTAMKELVKGNTQEYNTARGLIYEMAKKEKK